MTQNVVDIQSRLVDAEGQLKTAEKEELVTSSEEELLQQQKNLNEKLDITRQEINLLQSKLTKQKDLQERRELVISKLDDQKALLEESKTEMKLIVDENGLQFRQKVQQILIDKLLSKTNNILEKLSGRYYVRKVASEHGLAIEIEDTKQKKCTQVT